MAHDHEHDRHDTGSGEPGEIDGEFSSALILRPRQPYRDWAGEQAPQEPHAADEAGEPVVILTPELPRPVDRERWLAQHHAEVFERQLLPWTEDETRWPADRSPATLMAWFGLEWAPAVDDMSAFDVLPPVSCGPVSVPALVAEYKTLAPGSGFFLDVQNGEMVAFSPEELAALGHADAAAAGLPATEFEELIRLYESETLIALPSPSEEDDSLLMEGFAESIRVPATRNRLLSALGGKKPARRFLETVDVSGLRHRWLAFRDESIVAAMLETLQHYAVPHNTAPRHETAPAVRESRPLRTRH